MIRQSQLHTRAIDYLQETPTGSLIDQLPLPLAAILEGGEIVRASPGFDAMLGRKQGFTSGRSLRSVLTSDSYRMIGSNDTVIAFLRKSAGLVLGFRYRDGSVVHTVVGLPVLICCADRLLILAFNDITEELWSRGTTTAAASVTARFTENRY